MAISRREISDLVRDLFSDTVFETSPEAYIDLGIDRLNRDRPHIQILDYTVQAADVAEDGTIIATPTDFDQARDRLVSIEDLDFDGKRELPGIYITDWELYQTTSDTVVIQIYTTYDENRIFRISWRSSYKFTDSTSNIPDSLARPLTLITTYYYVNSVIAKLSQERQVGGDEIAFATQVGNLRSQAELYMKEYDGLVKELPQAPAGVTPDNIVQSAPSRMGNVI